MANSLVFVEYPACSTCRKARKWLESSGIAYIDRHIVEEAPTSDELRSWICASGLPFKRFFNTSGKLYRSLDVKSKLEAGMNGEEAIELLATDGLLVKRPIVVGDGFVLVGFREDEWAEKLL